MRVISGKFRDKKLISPTHNGIRPTTDRVKENLFNIINYKLEGSICLDLFGGTGSLGIEALSRGAKSVFIVDKNKNSFKNIQLNTRDMVGIISILSDYNLALLNFAHKNIKFDIIFIDPPYETNLAEYAITKIYELNLLNDNGIIIWESLTNLNKAQKYVSPFKIFDERKYGDVGLTFYSK